MGRGVVTGLLLLVLTACGFHLRGQLDLPPALASTYIESNGADSNLIKRLRSSLLGNGVVVTAKRSEATAILRILRDSYDRRVLSVGGGRKIREYEIHYAVQFELVELGGDPLVAPQTVELFRDYTYDEDDILGKQGEEASIRKDMIREAGDRILRIIQAALSQN
ncbi:MAG TPA: lipoprotein B transmembrane [Gammaproteobacteria bacterium]|nr:lipoprotein B transmembrane [Gammaproteobacteria bacterium]